MRKLLILLAICTAAGCATTAADKSQEQEAEQPAVAQGQPLVEGEEAAQEAVDDAGAGDIEFTTLKQQPNQPVKITGSVSGHQSNLYAVSGKKGELLSVNLMSANPQAYFNLYAPGDAPGKADALFNGPSNGTATFIQLPEDGNYMIQAFLMSAAARDNKSADYTITVQSYPADSPKFARVDGKTNVAVYKAAGDKDPLFLVAPGEILERGTCENPAGDFCLVVQAGGRSGWIQKQALTNL